MNCANHPDRERTAFCQNCGKPLCPECTRIVGSAVFCEPCLAAKLAGAPPCLPHLPAGHLHLHRQRGGVNYNVSGAIPPPPLPGEPNPGLAALLGFIPGVGAMYNGQYAKGVVHLIVFAILVSLANEHGIFGLFIAGWVCYQVIEAHHTARARRDGTPLPNPFGLNDLGERLGFGKAWPATPAPSTLSQAPLPEHATPSRRLRPTTPPAIHPTRRSQLERALGQLHCPPAPPHSALRNAAYPLDPNLDPLVPVVTVFPPAPSGSSDSAASSSSATPASSTAFPSIASFPSSSSALASGSSSAR